LADHTYSTFNLNLDYILPFAAILENGCEIDGLDDKKRNSVPSHSKLSTFMAVGSVFVSALHVFVRHKGLLQLSGDKPQWRVVEA